MEKSMDVCTIRAAIWPQDDAVIARLWQGYQHYLREIDCFDLGGETVDAELKILADIYLPGEGAVLIAESDGEPLGTVAVRPRATGEAEIRRLFVLRHARQRGLGKRLLQEAVELARNMGYLSIKLDTFRSQPGPQALYRSLGFEEVEAYNDYPAEKVMWFEKRL